RGRIAVVVARRADIVVVAVDELAGGGEPAAEGVLDLQRYLARERAGNAGHARFIGARDGGELGGGERAHDPGERGIEREPRQIPQRRILIAARKPAERGLTGDDARELE